MRLARRPLLALAVALPVAATAQDADPRLAERSSGRPDAPLRVIEFFSLTCGHCAAFHRDTWPQVKAELVDAGAIRMVWRDFPLDRLGLMAAAVARSLPEPRYEAFIGALLAAQDRWAFTRGNPIEELARMAALAGMPRARFDEVARDEAFARAILEQRLLGEREFSIQATPSFVFGREVHSGNLPFDEFRRKVGAVAPVSLPGAPAR